jgi:hypothetical protein
LSEPFFIGLYGFVVEKFVKQYDARAYRTSACSAGWRRDARLFKGSIGVNLEFGLAVTRASELVQFSVKAQYISRPGSSVKTINILSHDCNQLDVILHLCHEAVSLTGFGSTTRLFDL